MAVRHRGRHPEVIRITNAPESPETELGHRERRYIISMAIRTVCFISAIVVEGWLRWVLVAAAFVLPYVAVVMANSASPRVEGTDLLGPGPVRPELGPADMPPDHPRPDAGHGTI